MEEAFNATKMSAWIAGLLAASLIGCVKLLRFTPLPLLALYLFRRLNVGTNRTRWIHFPLVILLPCRVVFPLILLLQLGKGWRRESC
jgi:hypothetical protein